MPCAFCGEQFGKDRPKSDEHAWARWIGKELPRMGDEEGFRHTIRDTDTGEVLHQWAPKELDVVTGKVCRTCNEGWMEGQERVARPYLTSLMAARKRPLHREGQRALAAWANKTALALQLATPNAPKFPNWSYRETARAKSEPPKNTQVWLGAFEHGTFLHTAHPKALTLEGGSGMKADGYLVTFLVGHAVFQVFGHTHDEEMVITKGGTRARMATQIWPILDEPTWWPRDVVLRNTRDLNFFAKAPGEA
jgi:hypothetical protein